MRSCQSCPSAPPASAMAASSRRRAASFRVSSMSCSRLQERSRAGAGGLPGRSPCWRRRARACRWLSHRWVSRRTAAPRKPQADPGLAGHLGVVVQDLLHGHRRVPPHPLGVDAQGGQQPPPLVRGEVLHHKVVVKVENKTPFRVLQSASLLTPNGKGGRKWHISVQLGPRNSNSQRNRKCHCYLCYSDRKSDGHGAAPGGGGERGEGTVFPPRGDGALSRTSFHPNRASATTKKLWLTTVIFLGCWSGAVDKAPLFW